MLQLSELCRSFSCLPTRMLWELEHDPDQWAVRIQRARNYQDAKALVDRTRDMKDLPASPLIELVLDMTFEAKAALYEQRKLEAAERAKQKAQMKGSL